MLLAREAGISPLRAEAEDEVRQLVPPPPPPEVEPPPSEEEMVTVSDPLPAEPLGTTADLDAWLARIREHLEARQTVQRC